MEKRNEERVRNTYTQWSRVVREDPLSLCMMLMYSIEGDRGETSNSTTATRVLNNE